ncbi:DUF6231 family protein [Pokkaliibacter plantistimulans]|uniref:DUF6231 family protein n=1 Tax=Pokkaliibacter plantistimulans TaxID=1635171 RepID=UPI000D74B558|nr:DUF6231 family protein [Pokkaliibacter plantistimulans]
MVRSPNEFLLDRLQQLAPQRVVSIGACVPPALQSYCEQHDCQMQHFEAHDARQQLQGAAPSELILLTDALEHLPPLEGRALLGWLRNYCAPRVWLSYSPTEQDGDTCWQDADFYALGLTREQGFSQGQRKLVFYAFDLLTYNHVRTWNNPDNWANPENWGKYWW